MYAILVLFVKELLYDNAWSLCDWRLLDRGEVSQVGRAAHFLSSLGGLGSPHKPGRDNVLYFNAHP